MIEAVVIGIGNPDRGDDAVGREVVRRLRGRVSHHVDLREESGEPTRLLAILEHAESAYLIDACLSGAVPGTVQRLEAGEAALPVARYGFSTHHVGLSEMLELARALGILPTRCTVYAVEANSFEPGAPLSAAVRAAVSAVADSLWGELSRR